jgi:predicted Zn finger-like uncharacterized protein
MRGDETGVGAACRGNSRGETTCRELSMWDWRGRPFSDSPRRIFMSKARRGSSSPAPALLSASTLSVSLLSERVCLAQSGRSAGTNHAEAISVLLIFFGLIAGVIFLLAILDKLPGSLDDYRKLCQDRQPKTRCPHCGTTYYVKRRQINGETTCAKCGKVFKIKEEITLKEA